jgi:hypothetical protein
LAYAAEWKAYALERSIGRPAADVYLVNVSNGERTKIKDALPEDRYLRASPNGRFLLYFENDSYWTIDVNTRASVNITKNVRTSFVNRESDTAAKLKPPYGVAGWTKNDADVLLYDKYDLWKVSTDGSKSVRLTDGAADEVLARLYKLACARKGRPTSPSARRRTAASIWTRRGLPLR